MYQKIKLRKELVLVRFSILSIVKRNAKNAVRYLIEKQDADVNEKVEFDRTALFFAALDDLIDVAKLLLQHGADVNVIGNYFHSTPLIWTGEKDAYRVAKLLLDNNADRSDHLLNVLLSVKNH